MPKLFREVLILGLLALLPALGAAFFHPKRPPWNPDALGPGEVRLATVLAWKSNVLWVDVRTRKEYEKAHVPEAKLVNEDQWNALLPSFLEAWRPELKVVVYCDTRRCNSSQSVAKRLRELGIEPVYVLKGGWRSWQESRK